MTSEGLPSPAERLIRSVVAPASITSAVLYYFGWLRSQTIARDLGYDATLLGFGPQDYLLRSVQPVATLAIIGATVWWLLLLLHRSAGGVLRKQGSDWRYWHLLSYTMLGFGTLLVVDALDAAIEGFDRADWRLALTFVQAAALLGYGGWLQQFAGSKPWSRVAVPQPLTWIVMGLVAAGAFTVTSWYAQTVGHQRAEENRQMALEGAVATLTSAEPLHLEGVPSYAEGDHYITTGLVLLFSADGRHFLLPADYDVATRAKVYTVDASSVRIDFDRSISVPCAGFDDLDPGRTYAPGDVITSGGVRYTVAAVPPPVAVGESNEGLSAPDGAGQPPGATVEAAGNGFGQGLVIHLHQASLAPGYDAPYEEWSLLYRQRSDGVRVEINGSEAAVVRMTQVPADRAFRPANLAGVVGGDDGRIQLRPGTDKRLHRVAIGGTDLLLDCNPTI